MWPEYVQTGLQRKEKPLTPFAGSHRRPTMRVFRRQRVINCQHHCPLSQEILVEKSHTDAYLSRHISKCRDVITTSGEQSNRGLIKAIPHFMPLWRDALRSTSSFLCIFLWTLV